MDKQRMTEIVNAIMITKGMRPIVGNPNMLFPTPQGLLFYTFKKSSVYLVNLFYEEEMKESMFHQSVVKKWLDSLNLQTDRIFLLNLCLINGSQDKEFQFELPDMESNIISLYWLIDYMEERLVVPSGQPSNFLGLEKDFEKIINQKQVQVYKIASTNKIPYISMTMIAIISILMIAMGRAGGSESIEVLLRFGALNPLLVIQSEWYRLFTAMFLHIGFLHFTMNTMGILIFGIRLERSLKWWEWLIIYLGGGLIGNLASFLVRLSVMEFQVVAAGASGAIYALMGAVLTISYKSKRSVGGFDAYSIMLYVIIGLIAGAADMQVDNIAHISGLLGGAILALPFINRRKRNIKL